MAFDRSRSFEVENGIVAEEGGAGLFWSDSIPPRNGNEVDGDRLTDGEGRRWRFNSGEWLLDRDFSTREVLPSEVLEIKATEEMIVLKPIVNRGRIINRGTIRTPNLVAPEPVPFVQQDQFDYWDVPLNKTVTIPETQIMHPGNILKNKGIVRNLGKIKASTTLDYVPELEQKFPFELILEGETVTIRPRQQMLLKGALRNQGKIINRGRIVLI